LWAEDGCASIESWVAMRLLHAWPTAAETRLLLRTRHG